MATGTIAGSHSAHALQLAQQLVPAGERILAVYEPTQGADCKGAAQHYTSTACVAIPGMIFCCPCFCAKFYAKWNQPPRVFILTESHLHKAVAEQMQKGSVPLTKVRVVEWGDDEPTHHGIFCPCGKVCCGPVPNVSVEVSRGHPLATHGGYNKRHDGWQKHNLIVIYTEDNMEAGPVVRAAVKAAKAGKAHAKADAKDAAREQPPGPQQMERDAVQLVDGDWQQLTDEQRAAARALGYSQKKWDGDQHVPLDDKSWSELTKAQREAATTLGYTEAAWDAESDSSSA